MISKFQRLSLAAKSALVTGVLGFGVGAYQNLKSQPKNNRIELIEEVTISVPELTTPTYEIK